jgi:hypothetical protein
MTRKPIIELPLSVKVTMKDLKYEEVSVKFWRTNLNWKKFYPRMY